MRLKTCLLPVLLVVPPALADTTVQGTLTTSTWTQPNSPYRVQDTLRVPAGETITIEAGVDVLFDAEVPVYVEGSIHAEGTESDSVRFLPGAAERWRSIVVSGGGESSFAYTRLSDGLADERDFSGGALHVRGPGTRATLTNCVLSDNNAGRGGNGGAVSTSFEGAVSLYRCTLTGNRAGMHGGAIDGSSELIDCVISENSADLDGGGVIGTITATRCVFLRNYSWMGAAAVAGGGVFTDCTFEGNRSPIGGAGGVIEFSSFVNLNGHGDGRYFVDDRPIRETFLRRCHFIDNVTPMAPVYFHGDSLCHVSITECTFAGNSAFYGASAVQVSTPGNDAVRDQFPATRHRAKLWIEKTIIAGNRGRGAPVFADHADITMVNCTVADNQGRALALHPEGLGTIINSILWNNGGTESFPSNTSVSYSDIMGGWPGDGNIALDPLFVDAANGDYALQQDSPCIGAGSPRSIPGAEVYSSPPDMGAIQSGHTYWRGPTDVAEQADRPAAFALEHARPNPFNPSTTVSFAIPRDGDVRLTVYDVNGRLVRTLVDDHVATGEHTVVWNGLDDAGRAAASGVYIVRLSTPTETASRRLTLLR